MPVQLAASGPAHALRAVKVVWQREMIRFVRSKGRLISGLAQPLLLLFVLGSGLSGLTRSATGGVDFRTFLFPGIVATSTLFTAIFAGISIVWDREFGFLREMLVAPVPRSSILVGKCLGGGTIATMQALILVALAGLVGVPYNPVMIIALLLLLFLTALAMTAFGLMISVRIKKFQAVMPIVQLVLTPMMFLSGSLFPLAGLPVWLAVLTRINPLTYAVEPMRHVVFEHLAGAAGGAGPARPRGHLGQLGRADLARRPGHRAARLGDAGDRRDPVPADRLAFLGPELEVGEVEAGGDHAADQRAGVGQRLGRLPRAGRHQRLQQVTRAGVGADDQVVPGLRRRSGAAQAQPQRPEPLPEPQLVRADPVPARPLAGLQQEQDAGRGGPGPRVAVRGELDRRPPGLPEPATLRVPLQPQLLHRAHGRRSTSARPGR